MKNCLLCKKEYKPESNSQKYCSLRCRNKTYLPRISKWHLAQYDKEASKPDPRKIQCLICKKWYRKVGSHIKERHGMTARTYREKFDLEVKRGILTEYEREPLREHVMSNGTLKNLYKGRKYWFKKGSKTAGRYKRSHITMMRLKKLYTYKIK